MNLINYTPSNKIQSPSQNPNNPTKMIELEISDSDNQRDQRDVEQIKPSQKNSVQKSIFKSRRKEMMKQFQNRMDQRTKSSKLPVYNNVFGTINVDQSLAPTSHTRSKGAVLLYNQFISNPNPISLDDDSKQFKQGRYQYAQKQKQKPKHKQPQMKQSKLQVINLDKSREYLTPKVRMPKQGQSIYPPRKRQQQQPAYHQGIQYNIINNSRYFLTAKEKQQKRKTQEQMKKNKQQKQKLQKQQRLKSIQNTLSNLLGLTNQGGDHNKQQRKNPYQKSHQQQELKNLDILEQIQNQQQGLQNGAYFQTQQQRTTYQPTTKARYGLGEVVKAYDTLNAFPFVKAILSYKFTTQILTTNKKQIPNIFDDSEIYKKTFHYLVINQCIADLHQRMKKIQKQNAEKLQIQILQVSKLSNGMSELVIREIDDGVRKDNNVDSNGIMMEKQQKKNQKFLLKNYSMSRNRIGIITNKTYFRLQNYGISSTSKKNDQLSFTFLCLLKTPQSKQQLKQDVRAEASISQSDLEFILKVTKNRKAYFYDIQKLSTNIREYMSISNIQYSYLAEYIYNPKFIDNQKRNLVHYQTRDCINDVLEVLSRNFNSTQFQSIREMALRESGIVLLQGPPGTGKTSTLLGLLSAQYSYLRRNGDKRKIMICAPSNAAINHITKRIQTEGLVDGEGLKFHPNVLRMGIVQTDDPDITSCSLDHICESKILEQKNKNQKQSHLTTVEIRQNLMNIQKSIKNINYLITRAQRQRQPQKISSLQNELKQKNTEYLRMQSLLYSFRRQKIVSKKLYQLLQTKLMKQSEIIITTLSSSGTQKIEQIRGQIACLIVDQAAQATEPSLLIAFQTGVDKVMLIGDPYQLPATTLSTDSNITLFNRSLFQRFIDAGIQPYFLNIQYRMTPMIRQFPSQRFYQQRLIDGQNITLRQVPQILKDFAQNRSVIFIDLKKGQQKVQQNSYCNHKQAYLISKIIKKYELLDSDISVGIITPYQAQRKLLLNETFAADFSNNKTKNKKQKNSDKSDSQKNTKQKQTQNKIMINTVDSFQGQQKDLIIISTVRSNDRKQIGFLIDQRRINVSITRAKHAMIIIGNGDTLGSNQIWDSYLRFIESKKLYFQINSFQDEDNILNNLNNKNFYNTQQVRRRFYDVKELTFDPRKIKRNQIKSDDFKRKPKKLDKKQSQVQFSIQSKKLDQSKQLSSNFMKSQLQTLKHDKIVEQKSVQILNQNPFIKTGNQQKSNFIDINSYNGKSLKKNHLPIDQDIQFQAQQLIQKKRKKEQQVKIFQKQCQKIKQLQKQKANDVFYKFLFQ